MLFFLFVITCLYLSLSVFATLFYWFCFFLAKTKTGIDAFRRHFSKDYPQFFWASQEKVKEAVSVAFRKAPRVLLTDLVFSSYFVWYVYGL